MADIIEPAAFEDLRRPSKSASRSISTPKVNRCSARCGR
jgi:hypothetical protein